MRNILILMGAMTMAFGVAISAQAQDAGPEKMVKVSVGKAYIPQGFDNNDVARIVVEGFFPNTCYKMGRNEVKTNPRTREIEVVQTAYVYRQMCLMMIVPFHQTVEVGVLDNVGDYKVVDAVTHRELGELPVVRSLNDGPDDYIYATVADAYIGRNAAEERVVVLHGEVPGSCWSLTEKRIFLEGKDVLTVLPIMEQTPNGSCDDTPVPFTVNVPLPKLEPGRYLLNVRSLNGNAVTKLFDIKAAQ